MSDPLIQFVESVCVQTAVYWGAPQPDGFGGITYSDPVEISCRWDEKTKVVTDNNGKEIVSKAEVLVTQDVDEEGYLYLGTIDDLDSSEQDSPEDVVGAWEIKRVDASPLFRSTDKFVRVVYL